MKPARSFTPYRLVQGFTLIELLVVIAIVAVLSMVGFAVFTGVTRSARDAKRHVDIDAISKAYEVARSSRYIPLSTSAFSGGVTPQDPSKGPYFNWLDSNGTGFKICAALEDNPNNACNTPATTCYCKFSSQGTIPSGSSADGSSTQITLGLGGSSSSSCDPNGTLLSGLVGYWKMDESPGSTTALDSAGNVYAGVYSSGATTILGQSGFGNAGSFNGNTASVSITNYSNLAGQILNHFTYSLWVKYIGVSSTNQWPFLVGPSDTHRYPGVRGGSNYGQNIPNLEWGTDLPTCSGTTYTSLATKQAVSADSNWHQIAFTYDGTTVKSYFDGAYYNQKTQTGMCSGLSDFRIGWTYNGLIDDVRIYNRALSSPEISTLFNGGNGCIPQ